MLGDRGERSSAGGDAAGGFWVFVTVAAVLVLPMCVGFLGRALTGSTTNGVLAASAATIVLAGVLSRSVAQNFAPPSPLGARFRRRGLVEHRGGEESAYDTEDGFDTEGAHDSESATSTASASPGRGAGGPAAEENPWVKSASHRRTPARKPPGPRRAGGVPGHGKVPRGESNDLANIAKWANGSGVARTPIDPTQGGFVAFGVFLLPAVVASPTPRIPAGAPVIVTAIAAEAVVVAPTGGAAAHV